MKREEFGEYIVRWGSLMINNPQSSEHEQASKELDIKYNELFDHIESIEAENKELKAKLEAIQSNKVAEFSGDSYELEEKVSNFMEFDTENDEHYTVTISKDKQ